MLFALSTGWNTVSAVDYSGNNEWENPTVFERGKEKPHAWFKTSYVKYLNGMWRFRYDDDIIHGNYLELVPFGETNSKEPLPIVLQTFGSS